jgi:uncharacterized protein YndB with AHSA1/START domain
MGWSIEAVREAPVSPEAVFALYADPTTWPTWGHNAPVVRADGPLAVGGVVHVRAGYGKTYPCLVRRLEPGRALELVVRPPGMTIVNVYEVAPTGGGGSRIRHAFLVSGPVGAVARVFGIGRVYRGWLAKEVDRVVELAASAP